MTEFKKALRTAEVPPGCAKEVEVEGKALSVFNVNGTFYALDDICPHKGGPLSEGSLEGTVVTCPWHGWKFDVQTGISPINPQAQTQTYPVKVEGDDILVAV